MRDIRHVARQRWRELKRRHIRREAIMRFFSGAFIGAALATIAAIMLHR
jgi:hypothetical protein